MSKTLMVRIPSSLGTLLIALAMAFVFTRAVGDPVAGMLGVEATDAQIAEVRRSLGMDKPLPQQFWDYVVGLAQGDFGTSLRYSESNWSLIAARIPATVQLAAAALAIACVGGVGLGVLAALHEGKWMDKLASSLSLLGQSIPLFWLGLMLILGVAVNLGWLPAGQSGGFDHLILPAVTLATLPLAGIARLTRSSMLEVLHQPYIVAAKARGLSGAQVIVVHAMRNAALPVVTLLGLQAGSLFSGAVTVEFVYSWPGLGTLATQAVQFRDFTLVQAIVAFGAVVFVVINLCVDLLYGVIDPRIRRGA